MSVRKCRSAFLDPQMSVRKCRSACASPQMSGPQMSVRKCKSANVGPQVRIRKCRSAKKYPPDQPRPNQIKCSKVKITDQDQIMFENRWTLGKKFRIPIGFLTLSKSGFVYLQVPVRAHTDFLDLPICCRMFHNSVENSTVESSTVESSGPNLFDI